MCLQHPPLRTLLAKKSGKEKKKKVTKEEKPPWSCSRLGRKDPPLPPNPNFVSGSPSRHFLVVTLLAAEGAAANTSFYLEYMLSLIHI